MAPWLICLEVLLPVAIVAGCRLRGRPRSADLVLAAPALLAPLALIYPWAAVPDHLGVGFAGPQFFWRWLTKYPTLGPINFQVLCGLACITFASVLPAALAVYHLAGGRRRLVLVVLAVAAVIVYVPLLLRLDWDLWLVGVLGAPTLLGHVSTPAAACGPLVRLLALLSAIAVAGRAVIARPRPAHAGR